MTPKCPDCKRDQDDCVCVDPQERIEKLTKVTIMKISELIGPALDWAVAKCEGASPLISWDKRLYGATGDTFDHSTDWLQGGPIIEREGIFIVAPYRSATSWKAYKMEPDQPELPCWLEDGSTPLIAAMRCYVASKLGDEIEVPEELK